MSDGVVFYSNPIPRNIVELGAKLTAGLTALMAYEADRGEEYMKSNAPWTDRTGNARGGLKADPFAQDHKFGVVYYHQVPYGIWLEVKHSGEYSIITPTVQWAGQEIMKSVHGLMAVL